MEVILFRQNDAKKSWGGICVEHDTEERLCYSQYEQKK